MRIAVEKIHENPKRIDLTLSPEDIDLEGEPIRLLGVAVFSGDVRRLDDRVELRGTAEVPISVDCTRCLEPVEQKLAIPFRDLFVDSLDTDPEKSVSDDQLDESRVADGHIDLAEVLREQILLAVPEQTFCRDNCKGLCPQCGTNLNLIDCKCADDEIDPRWAALKI